MRIYLIRHGETILNASRTIQWSVFHQRVERAWREVCEFAASAEGDFAVVSHELVCRALVELCVPVPEHLRPPQVRFGNTALTCIDGPPWEVSLLACCTHLDADQITYPNH